MSSAVMSTTVVNPATTEAASASSTSLHSRPMTTPSSPSAVVRCDCGGSPVAGDNRLGGADQPRGKAKPGNAAARAGEKPFLRGEPAETAEDAHRLLGP